MYENFQIKHLETMGKLYAIYPVKNWWYLQINAVVFLLHTIKMTEVSNRNNRYSLGFYRQFSS